MNSEKVISNIGIFVLSIIVISSNTCWSVFNFRLELLSYLSKTHQIEIIAPQDQYSDKLRQLGFTVHDIAMAPSSVAPFKDLLTLISYVRLLRKIKPDYYLGFTAKPNIYGSLIAGWLGCKVVNNIAGLGRTFSTSGVMQWLMHLLYRVGISKSHHVFFQNKDDRELFEQHRLLGNVSRSVLPGSGVNTTRFSRKVDCSTENLTDSSVKSFVFLFSARLLLEKGIREYIAAAKMLKTLYPHCRFQVLGKHASQGESVNILLN